MRTLALTLLALTLGACRSTPAPDPALPNTLTAVERAQGWQLLFDGTSLEQWRSYRKPGVEKGWRAEEGTIARVGAGGDLISREEYGSFILDLEWKISPQGNSGILFHVTEDRGAVYETGPEFQILDNRGFGDELDALHAAGANYALHAPAGDYTVPVGQWNHARIEVRGPEVVHWLNGHRLLAYTLWSPDWKERAADSKFAAMPGYGMARRGHLALQDHGNPVWFRNVKILPLD